MDGYERKIDLEEAYVQENYTYYKTEWTRLAQEKISFNFAAFLFPVLWLGYRKMYKHIIIIAFLYFIVTVLHSTVESHDWLRIIDAFYTLLISFFYGFLGNSLYKKQTAIQVETTCNKHLNQHEREKRLNKKGGVSGLGVFIAVLLVMCTYTIPMIVVEFTLL